MLPTNMLPTKWARDLARTLFVRVMNEFSQRARNEHPDRSHCFATAFNSAAERWLG